MKKEELRYEKIEGGLRTRDVFHKKSEPKPEKPLISIITVVRNGEKYLEQTIQSVLNQTYENIEYIIIDGASTDGTLDIIRKYEDLIAYWISEPDGGIYDAMNKGIDLVSGKWINFMNGGDQFCDDDTIKNLFKHDKGVYDLLYGDCEVLYDEFLRLQKPLPIDYLWKGMIFSHQSMFIKADIQKGNKYNILNKIGADFELIFKLKTNGFTFRYINTKICKIKAGGLSDIKRVRSIKSQWDTVKKYKQLSVHIYYTYVILDAFLRMISKRLLPERIVEKLIKLKWRSKFF